MPQEMVTGLTGYSPGSWHACACCVRCTQGTSLRLTFISLGTTSSSSVFGRCPSGLEDPTLLSRAKIDLAEVLGRYVPIVQSPVNVVDG